MTTNNNYLNSIPNLSLQNETQAFDDIFKIPDSIFKTPVDFRSARRRERLAFFPF